MSEKEIQEKISVEIDHFTNGMILSMDLHEYRNNRVRQIARGVKPILTITHAWTPRAGSSSMARDIYINNQKTRENNLSLFDLEKFQVEHEDFDVS